MQGRRIGMLLLAWLWFGTGLATAAELRADMHKATATGPGEAIGTVTIADGASGAAVKTALTGLPPGPHGFHIHENGSCQPTTANGQPVPAGGAGGHFDPQKSGKHEGPEGAGHLGDLPLLQAAADRSANQTLTVPHIKDVAALRGKAGVIQGRGDQYNHQPGPPPRRGGA